MHIVSTILFLVTLLNCLFANAALISNNTDGNVVINTTTSLNVSDGQTFNYASLNILSGGSLNFSSSTSGTNLILLSSSDILIDGSLTFENLNATIETTGNIILNGSILFLSSGTLTINSPINLLTASSGQIQSNGGSIFINISSGGNQGPILNNNPISLDPSKGGSNSGTITIPNVPAVPLPSALWLFASVLPIFGWSIRKKV